MKNKWNTIVFLCYIAYCVFFFFLFWCAFDNKDQFYKYYNLAFNGLLTTVGVSSLVQIIAIIAKRKFAIRWLLGGVFLLFLTIAFAIGQSV